MADIEAPITLVGIGRSGTTLLEKAFQASEQTNSIGETLGVISGTYSGALDSFFYSKKCTYTNQTSFARSVVHNLFDSLFDVSNGKYEHWFHKPAGLPKMISWERYRVASDSTAFPTRWYWDMFENIFPRAKYLVVLRNPWEIVQSRIVFSGWGEAGGWEDINILYDILESKLDCIEVVFFTDLTNDPEEVISNLFFKFGISKPLNLREVVNIKYVSTDKEKLNLISNSLVGPNYSEEEYRKIANVWLKFGRKFDSPKGQRSFFEPKKMGEKDRKDGDIHKLAN